jgi:hypothetical protein
LTRYDWAVLALQVGGFFGYIILRLLGVSRHWPDAFFSVHFVGDVLFVIKEKFMSEFQKLEQSFLTHVKLLPWAQFVGAWLSALGLLTAALAGKGFWFGTGQVLAVIGVVIGLLATIFSVLGKPVVTLPHLLSFGGLILAGSGASLLGSHVAWFFFAFVGLGASQAGQWYDEIYP